MGVFGGGEVTYAAPTFIAVAVTSTQIRPANTLRKQLILVNDSDTPIFLAVDAAAVVGSGTRINSNGGVIQYGGPGGIELTTEAVNGIHGGAGTKNLTIQEAT